MNLEGLHDWQQAPTLQLERAMEIHGASLNASDMGVGKTYMAAALLREQDKPALVVAPLATLPSWERVLTYMGTEATVLNYEQVKKPGSPYGRWVDPRLTNEPVWQWSPEVRAVVFDEVHRCKGDRTQNCELLMGAKRQNLWLHMMSGTPAQSPLDMRALGYALNFYKGDEYRNWYGWCLRNGCIKMPRRGLRFTGAGERSAPQIMSEFHRWIFPERGVRLRADEIEGYPETQITAESFHFATQERLNEVYALMAAAVERWRLRSARYRDPDHPLTKMIRERTLLELLKVPTLADLTIDAVEDGRSVVVFLNFKESISELRHTIAAKSDILPMMYHGGMTPAARSDYVDRFQADQDRVIIVQIDAGGTGLNLHDVTGVYPRAVFACPGFSALNLLQALRRVHRDGAKTKSVQRIVLATGTIEDQIRKNLERKMNNLDALTDEDLTPENLRIEGKIIA